jgi:opacity protein-like surface antigen
MTKKFNLFFPMFVAGILLFANAAFAGCDGFYLAGRSGGARIELKDHSSLDRGSSNYVVNKDRFIAGGALGYRYKHIRAEAEYTWRHKKDGAVTYGFNHADTKSQSYMFVLYYDFFPYFWFTPFVNAGVGMTQNRLKIKNNLSGVSVHKAKDDEFTWSLGGGISLKLTNRWNADFGYRYYDMGKIAVLNGKTDVKDQEVYAGLRYVFN